jgi:hypothetical protein
MTYSYDFAVAGDDRTGAVYLQCGAVDCLWEHQVGTGWSESTLAALHLVAARHLLEARHDTAEDAT